MQLLQLPMQQVSPLRRLVTLKAVVVSDLRWPHSDVVVPYLKVAFARERLRRLRARVGAGSPEATSNKHVLMRAWEVRRKSCEKRHIQQTCTGLIPMPHVPVGFGCSLCVPCHRAALFLAQTLECEVHSCPCSCGEHSICSVHRLRPRKFRPVLDRDRIISAHAYRRHIQQK